MCIWIVRWMDKEVSEGMDDTMSGWMDWRMNAWIQKDECIDRREGGWIDASLN